MRPVPGLVLNDMELGNVHRSLSTVAIGAQGVATHTHTSYALDQLPI